MSRGSSEYKKLRERRSIAATVGYCFVIVLIVLFVMSKMLTETYTAVLESERADAMESLVVAQSTVLGHTTIEEGMKYPIPVPNYAPDKPYIIDIYTKAGNSFLRLYSSTNNDSLEQYYLSGVGDEYDSCFELQQEAFTTRTEDGVKYVCAIAPIISSENTVAGILEIRMPYSDFTSTVNGMSLSWILTIFSIAVSMGIIIFELNLFVSTLTKGIKPNVPVLIMYGEGAIRFLSFFMALGAVMPVIVIAETIRDSFPNMNNIVQQILVLVGIALYAFGFFSFSALRKTLKFKLTSRIALIITTAFGYFLSLVIGLTGNAVVALILALPMAFCFSMPCDSLRDYRINAGKLGYEGFDDRTVHNIQSAGYMMGISVGAVIGGICFERFGLLVVNIIAGAALILTSLGISFFMKDNVPVKESYLPINKWLELVSNKYTGRFLTSTFFVLGTVVSFLLGFVPNYITTVGISLATASFYYLVATFAACFIAAVIKNRFSHVLTSKVRVIISSIATVAGLLVFALMPTAKVLVVTVALLGISLGIHDYYYLYVLFLLSEGKIKANLRKAAENSFLAGIIIALPVFTLALLLDMRIVFVVAAIILFFCAFAYPMSSYSNNVDDRDPALKKSGASKKPAKKSGKKAAPAANANNAPAQQMPVQQMPAQPQAPVQQVPMQDPYGQNVYGQDPYAQDPYAQSYGQDLYANVPNVDLNALLNEPIDDYSGQPGMYQDPYAQPQDYGYPQPQAQQYDPYNNPYGYDPNNNPGGYQ